MRWDDERYVRLYAPRNDGDWDMWPWQARALFPLMLRKADRIGIVKCGKHGRRALAHMVGLPQEHVEVGLDALLEDGCVQEPQPGTLFIRNYLTAQEAAQTDRARKEAQRERERDRVAAEVEGILQSVTNRDPQSQNVTMSHETGQNVTNGHTVSQTVTPVRSGPCREEEIPTAPRSGSTFALEEPTKPPAFDLEAIYAAYPRKEGRKKGLARLRQLVTSRLKYDAIMGAVRRYSAQNAGTDKGYLKHFDTFVNCWEDYAEPTPGAPSTTTEPRRQPTVDEVLAAREARMRTV